MGKLVTIATKARFNALREASSISETSLNFILETGQLYTHNIFINGAQFGTATSNYVPLTIAGTTKNVSLNGHTHSNYYSNSSDIDIGSNKIVSGTSELLKFTSDTLILGNSSNPTEFFGTLKTTKNGTKYTILDTNNFSIVNKTSTGLTLNNVALFSYGGTTFQLDYVKRLNTVDTFNNLAKYTSAGTTNENSSAYGFLTMSTDTGTNTYQYAQIRVNIPNNTLEFRTSSDTTWKTTLHGGTYRNISINGTNYSILTKASSLPTIIAPTAVAGTGGAILATKSDKSGVEWVQHYIGTTQVQTTSTSQALTGISGVKSASGSRLDIGTNDASNSITLCQADVPYFRLDTNHRVHIGNNVSANAATQQLQVDGYTLATGFMKTDSSNSYVLLGGGGHKALSQFVTSSKIESTITADLTTSWTEIDNLTTKLTEGDGSYMLQVTYASCIYTGTFSYVSGGTVEDEIVLHCSGTIDGVGGTNRGRLYAKIGTSSETTYLKLAVSQSESNANLSIKYRKLI